MISSKTITAGAIFALASLIASPAALACGGCGCKAAKPAKSQAAQGDIVETAIAAGKFKTLVAAAQAAGLVEALKGKGPLTVLAPTDEAFAKLPEGTLETLLKPENKDQLKSILLYHVIPAKATAAVVATLTEVKTLSGKKLTISIDDDHIHINDGAAHVTKTDVMTTNGVIHVIDTVLLPPAAKTASAE